MYRIVINVKKICALIGSLGKVIIGSAVSETSKFVTPSLCSSLTVGDQISQPYKTTDKT
jgi:hypothetical protein